MLPPVSWCWVVLAWVCIGPALAESSFTLTSPDLTPGGRLPDAQVLAGPGCTGASRSPALAWSTPPAGTRSLAITVHDPDARGGRGWWHWAVFDLPPDLRGLPVNAGAADAASLPKAARQGRNDRGLAQFSGACPPPGDPPHHYVFTVWALDIDRLAADANAADATIGALLHQHAIGTASLTALYGR